MFEEHIVNVCQYNACFKASKMVEILRKFDGSFWRRLNRKANRDGKETVVLEFQVRRPFFRAGFVFSPNFLAFFINSRSSH